MLLRTTHTRPKSGGFRRILKGSLWNFWALRSTSLPLPFTVITRSGELTRILADDLVRSTDPNVNLLVELWTKVQKAADLIH